jgi:hypothetical protein
MPANGKVLDASDAVMHALISKAIEKTYWRQGKTPRVETVRERLLQEKAYVEFIVKLQVRKEFGPPNVPRGVDFSTWVYDPAVAEEQSPKFDRVFSFCAQKLWHRIRNWLASWEECEGLAELTVETFGPFYYYCDGIPATPIACLGLGA